MPELSPERRLAAGGHTASDPAPLPSRNKPMLRVEQPERPAQTARDKC